MFDIAKPWPHTLLVQNTPLGQQNKIQMQVSRVDKDIVQQSNTVPESIQKDLNYTFGVTFSTSV